MIAAFNPRNPNVSALKAVGQKIITYVDLELFSNLKPIQQYTIDIVVSKIGGIRQFLILIAKVDIFQMIVSGNFKQNINFIEFFYKYHNCLLYKPMLFSHVYLACIWSTCIKKAWGYKKSL